MVTLLVDAHAAVYRAYYSTGNLSTRGNPTGIPYGVFWSLLLLAERFHSNRFVFCWDSKVSRRKAIFPDYKRARSEDLTNDELEERREIHRQIDTLHFSILPVAGFKNHRWKDGFEADDLIANEVIDNPKQSYVGVSGDNDLFQLLRFHNFKLFDPRSSKLWTASTFAQEYGVTARDWVLVKSIAGCPGDGVPGVPGVRIKTAIQYINGDLSVGKKYKDIVANFPLLKRNYRLVSLPFVGAPPAKMLADNLDAGKLANLFGDLDFRSFLEPSMERRWATFVKGVWK